MNSLKDEDLVEAFASIENHDLKAHVIICAVCGCMVNFNEKNQVMCEHLQEMFEGCEGW